MLSRPEPPELLTAAALPKESIASGSLPARPSFEHLVPFSFIIVKAINKGDAYLRPL